MPLLIFMRVAKYGRDPDNNAKQNIVHQCESIKGITQYKGRDNKPKTAEHKYPKIAFHFESSKNKLVYFESSKNKLVYFESSKNKLVYFESSKNKLVYFESSKNKVLQNFLMSLRI